jgi:hypothetical protein
MIFKCYPGSSNEKMASHRPTTSSQPTSIKSMAFCTACHSDCPALHIVCLRVCRKSKAIELMVVDALLEADPVLKISEKIWQPEEFARLDDGLLSVSGYR